jgi:hypothetical protein
MTFSLIEFNKWSREHLAFMEPVYSHPGDVLLFFGQSFLDTNKS